MPLILPRLISTRTCRAMAGPVINNPPQASQILRARSSLTHSLIAKKVMQRVNYSSNSVTANTAECSAHLHAVAMQYSRKKDTYLKARHFFLELLTRVPGMCSVWVSWGMMEKRYDMGLESPGLERCRLVFQWGLTLNPHSVVLIQAWGLMELQRGNNIAALKLLERSAHMDPERCMAVLKWQQVVNAREFLLQQKASQALIQANCISEDVEVSCVALSADALV